MKVGAAVVPLRILILILLLIAIFSSLPPSRLCSLLFAPIRSKKNMEPSENRGPDILWVRPYLVRLNGILLIL